MKVSTCTMLLVAAASLTGCQAAEVGGGGGHDVNRGRYTGIGIYSADAMWAKIAVDEKPADAASATPADDTTVIVVVDTNSGEVRQCGNLSGRCVAMNPWSRAIGKPGTAPLPLTDHADTVSNEVAASPEPADGNDSAVKSR
jgi:hypothetical protein